MKVLSNRQDLLSLKIWAVENSKLLPAVMMKDPASTSRLEVRETAYVSAGQNAYPAQRPARE